MPLLKGSASFTRFLAEPPSGSSSQQAEQLIAGLRQRAFEPIRPEGEDERAAGFVEFEDNASTEFSTGAVFQGDWLLCAYRVDQIRIPAAQLREALADWAQSFELENERPPSRFEKTEAKVALRREFRAATPPVTKAFDVAWNLATGELQIYCLSRKLVEELQLTLEKSCGVELKPRSPQVLADEQGIPDSDLKPTPDLCWPGLDGM